MIQTVTAQTFTQKENFYVAMEISADEMTPLDFSKVKIFSAPKYGLFVEILEDGIVYTIRAKTAHGYTRIIEEDPCYEAINDSWSIYKSA